jgi:glucokinase
MQIGLDLGGTKCLGVALEFDPGRPLEVLAEHRATTPVGTEAILDMMAAVASHLAVTTGATQITLGVGVPGLITLDGVMRASPNLPGMYEVNIAEEISARLHELMPEILVDRVYVNNDANCAALAEWAYGAGRGSQDLLLVTLGTGIGGGLVLSGAPYRGRHGFAGEFGHMVIDPEGVPCPCGQRGCWERYGSGSGLAYLAQQAGLVLDGPRGALAPKELRAEDVVAAARAGSQLAVDVLKDFSRWIALGLVNLANIVDPEVIVIAGGLAVEEDLFMPEVRRLFAELLYEGTHRDHPVITVAQSDHRAGAIGAAVGATL